MFIMEAVLNVNKFLFQINKCPYILKTY